MLQLLEIEWLAVDILQGFVTSAGTAATSTLYPARKALLQHVEMLRRDKPLAISSMYGSLLRVIERNLTNDRFVIPALEVAGFLFDMGIFSDTNISMDLKQVSPLLYGTGTTNVVSYRRLLSLTQKAHYKTGNVQKLDAAIQVYSNLLHTEVVSKDVKTKLVGMLLHPYPKVCNFHFVLPNSAPFKLSQLKANGVQVRNSVADTLYAYMPSEALKCEDWGAPVKALKGTVEEVRSTISS